MISWFWEFDFIEDWLNAIAQTWIHLFKYILMSTSYDRVIYEPNPIQLTVKKLINIA